MLPLLEGDMLYHVSGSEMWWDVVILMMLKAFDISYPSQRDTAAPWST